MVVDGRTGRKRCDHAPLCETPITAENDSDEHLIPNALGGRRKVSGFLYRDCNSRTGEAWDAWRLNFFLFCLLLDVARERGEPPNLSVVTSAAKRLTIGPNRTLYLSAPGDCSARPPSDEGPSAEPPSGCLPHRWSTSARSLRGLRRPLKRQIQMMDAGLTVTRMLSRSPQRVR